MNTLIYCLWICIPPQLLGTQAANVSVNQDISNCVYQNTEHLFWYVYSGKKEAH